MANILEELGLVPKPIDANSALAGLNGRMQQAQPDIVKQTLMQGLLASKKAYDTAQKDYNTAGEELKTVQGLLSVGGLDEAQIKGLSDRQSAAQQVMQNAQKQMEQAHTGAERQRALAKEMNYDFSNYDSTVPLDQANFNFQADTLKTIKNFINNDLDSDQYYDEAYRALRAAGATKGQAKRIAANRAQLYKSERLAKYATMMNMFGQSNGAMNPMGSLFLSMLSRNAEDPSAAGLGNTFGNLYASPQKQYDNAVIADREQAARNDAAAMAAIQRADALNTLLTKAKINADAAAKQHQYKKDEIVLTGDVNLRNSLRNQENQAGIDERKAENDMRRTIEKIAKEKEIDLNNIALKDAATIRSYIELYLRYHPNESTENAVNFAFQKMFGQGNGKENPKEKEMTEKEKKILVDLKEVFVPALNDPTDDNINKLDEWLEEHRNEIPYADMYEESKYFYKMLKGLQYKMKYDDDNAALEWSVVPRDILQRYLKEYNFENYDE